jgi:histidinol-phosphatase
VNGDLAFAHALADVADAITTSRFRASDLRVETKPDLTPVSEADRAAEEAIRGQVAASGRGEGVLGEEYGDDGSDVRWIVDPIDGTRNFLRGIPIWATLLALERDGRVVCGVASAPALGRRWWAARGEGAWRDGERINVSRVSELAEGAVAATYARDLAAIEPRVWHARGLGDFWQHVLVAEGALDAAVDAQLEVWDYAPLGLIVGEAGGRLTDLDGRPPSPGAQVVSSNGVLHDSVLAALS